MNAVAIHSFVLVLVLVMVSRLVAAEPTLRLADGSSKPAKLVAVDIDADGTLFFASQTGDAKPVRADDVIAWGMPREPAGGDLLLLADGGVLVADILSMKSGTAVVDSRTFGEIEVPTSYVQAIILRPPLAIRQRDAYIRKARSAQLRSDQVWLANGDTLDGALSAIDDESIQLRQGERNVTLPLDAIAAILLSRKATEPAKHALRHATIGFADGSRIVADEFAFAKEQQAAKIRSGDLSFSVDPAKIVFLQPSSKRITYLSDLKPVTYRHIPLLDVKWDHQPDANVLGGKLRCRDRLYLKGLGVHSASVLTYRVPDGTKQLVGRIGIDDSANGGGSAIFRVFVDDGSGKWKSRFTSEVVRGGEAPRDITIDLKDARQVSLMVDYADRGDVLDHADWLDVAFIQ